jgi:hypothetical protein
VRRLVRSPERSAGLPRCLLGLALGSPPLCTKDHARPPRPRAREMSQTHERLERKRRGNRIQYSPGIYLYRPIGLADHFYSGSGRPARAAGRMRHPRCTACSTLNPDSTPHTPTATQLNTGVSCVLSGYSLMSQAARRAALARPPVRPGLSVQEPHASSGN